LSHAQKPIITVVLRSETVTVIPQCHTKKKAFYHCTAHCSVLFAFILPPILYVVK